MFATISQAKDRLLALVGAITEGNEWFVMHNVELPIGEACCQIGLSDKSTIGQVESAVVFQRVGSR